MKETNASNSLTPKRKFTSKIDRSVERINLTGRSEQVSNVHSEQVDKRVEEILREYKQTKKTQPQKSSFIWFGLSLVVVIIVGLGLWYFSLSREPNSGDNDQNTNTSGTENKIDWTDLEKEVQRKREQGLEEASTSAN